MRMKIFQDSNGAELTEQVNSFIDSETIKIENIQTNVEYITTKFNSNGVPVSGWFYMTVIIFYSPKIEKERINYKYA